MLVHTTSAGHDSAAERFYMWQAILSCMTDHHNYLFGFGAQATGPFLQSQFGVGSAHNMYMDALFNGGLIYLGILLYTLWISLQRIRHNKDQSFRIVMTSALVAFCIHDFFESGASLLESNYFSVIPTIFLLLLPLHYSGIKGNKLTGGTM